MVLGSRRLVIAWFITFSAAVGCGGPSGPERAELHGKVTIDGQPVEQGSIAVIPEKGPTAGAEIKGGSYRIPAEAGPVLGKSRVEIKATHKTGKQIEAGSPFPPGTMHDEVVSLEFKDEDSLTVDIKSGENEKDFNLTSPAKK